MTQRYKIRVKGDINNDEFDVWENGSITHVMWKNSNGAPFSLAYETKSAIQYLKEGRWIRVPSKKQKALKSPNLFSFDDV